MAEGTESVASGDKELLSAMEELQRAQQRVAQLREQNRQTAIAEVMEKIKMYDLRPEELGFSRSAAVPKAGRKSALQQPVSQAFPAPSGAAPMLEGASVGGDRRSQVKPKYRSPDGSETWSGRGKAPKWMKDLLDAGKRKEDYEIDRSNSGSAE